MMRVVVAETAKADIANILDDLKQRAGPRTAQAYAAASHMPCGASRLIPPSVRREPTWALSTV